MTNGKTRPWLLLAGLFLLLLALAATRPMAVPDEGRYGEIGRWMLQSGDWLTARLNGIPFFHKPPYLYWLEAASLAVFGSTVWALRVVPALHAAVMLGALYLAARHLAGGRIALRAALMLGTSLSFLLGGQYINHDMLVAAWIGVAIWCFALAFLAGDKPHAWLARAGFAACAFGMLSKGLIGIALPGLALFIWLLWTKQFRKVLYLPWLSGLALFAAIALPWFVLAAQRYPQLMAYMFGYQQFGRYTGAVFNNARPWWFYLACLVPLLFPWIFFTLLQGVRQAKEWRAPATAQAAWTSLLWIWPAAIVGFFSVPHSKLIGYILPVMPPLALLAALGWERALAQRRHEARWFATLCVLAIAIAVGANVAAGRYTRKQYAQDVAAVLACAAGPADTVYAIGEFPYDLPFHAQTARPLIAVQDWPALRKTAGDNWRREMFEGTDFEPATGAVLQTPDVLQAASAKPGNWLLAPRAMPAADPQLAGWTPVRQGEGWSLFRSSAPEGPVAAEHKSLPGCKNQGGK